MRALTLASLLEKQLISPVEAATLKGLMSPFREKFINEIEKIIIPDIDDAVSDVSQKRTSEDNKLERLCLIIEQANMLDDRASSKNARVGFNTTIRRGFISSAAPATALTLAENVGKHVSGFASDFIISAAGHVVDGGLSSLFLTSYNEYKRIGDLAKKEKQIEETIQESETAQLLLQKNYALHSQIYEDLLYRMEMDQLSVLIMKLKKIISSAKKYWRNG